jgi:hypothetical protein
VQGDSRRLREVIREASLIVSSPPYAQALGARDHEGDQGKYYLRQKKYNDLHPEFKRPDPSSMTYSNTPGNLANMKEGNIDLVVSSPPYVGSMESDKGGIDWEKAGRMDRTKPSEKRHSVMSNNDPTSYGQSPGQLGSMKEGSFDMCVSSPPYDEGLGHGMRKIRPIDVKKRIHMAGGVLSYGESDGQLAGASTFWQASKEIVQGCYDLLKPGGHAIWVCKDYVKAKKRVPFSDRWLSLCESVGFTLVCRHQAMLVKHHGDQSNIHGGTDHIETRRISFFRRLAESKGSPKIEWEDVLCMEKTK